MGLAATPWGWVDGEQGGRVDVDGDRTAGASCRGVNEAATWRAASAAWRAAEPGVAAAVSFVGSVATPWGWVGGEYSGEATGAGAETAGDDVDRRSTCSSRIGSSLPSVHNCTALRSAVTAVLSTATITSPTCSPTAAATMPGLTPRISPRWLRRRPLFFPPPSSNLKSSAVVEGAVLVAGFGVVGACRAIDGDHTAAGPGAAAAA
eukprot:5670944-Prymnesium_polylepis.1